MWKDNLIALKGDTTLKEIEEGTGIPERTLARIFSKSKDNMKSGHSISTIIPIVRFLKGSLDEIFADTNAIIGSKSVLELQEKLSTVLAENVSLKSALDLANANNAIAKEEVQSLLHEVELLKTQNMYKDKIIALLEVIETKKE